MSGSIAEYDRFYREHRQRLVVTAAQMLAGDIHQAEELVDEAFEKAFRQWHRIDSPRAWFRTVIARSVYKRSRRLGRLQSVLGRIHAVERSVTAPDPSALLELREDYVRVRKALAGLSERQRAVVVLYWYEGCSPESIATQLRISRSTVAAHLARAYAHLARELGPHSEVLDRFDDHGEEQR
ncbi:sigma-70 family RNA polymerase sigma factor [Streptomyces sp. NPDC005820]|uniref:RNA polymerase sigma factor n=1 Tax=Streptomyces sp. NPDC005820 TaxID=3157069 RepID=UPI0033E85B72